MFLLSFTIHLGLADGPLTQYVWCLSLDHGVGELTLSLILTMSMELSSLEAAADEAKTSEPAIKKKLRVKKVKDKWCSMYYVPLDVINYRKKVGGRLAPRNGLAMYRDLACKSCGHVSHSRHAAQIHEDTWHRKEISDITTVQRRRTSPRSNFATRISARINQRKSHEILEVVSLDEDEEEDQDSDKSFEGHVEVLEEESALSNSTIGKKTHSELDELAKSSLFQPEIGLSLALTKAIRKEKLKNNTELEEKNSPTPELNTTFTKKCSTIRSTISSLLGAGGEDDRHKNRQTESPVEIEETPVRRSRRLESIFSNKGKKRPLSGLKKSVQKVIDWSAVIRGKEAESPATVTSASPSRKKPQQTAVSSASPARKRPFKPVSLLNRFNNSVSGNSENDSGLGDSDQSSECSPVQSLRTPSIRVRSFAATSSRNNIREPDISVISPIIIPEREMETNNSTSKMFMDIFSSPSLQGSAGSQERGGKVDSQKNSSILDDSIQEISVSLDEEEHVISMETTETPRNKQHEEKKDSNKKQEPNNKKTTRKQSVADESDDDIVMLDVEKTPVAQKSRNVELMDQELSAKVDSFVSHLQSKSKFTSTPKSTRSKVIQDEHDDGIEIVDIL